MYGGLEAGGTKFVCAVAEAPDAPPIDSTVIPTTTPQETLDQAIAFFRRHAVRALGIASFGPVDLRRDSPTYGFITTTPKPGWRSADVLGTLVRALGVPAEFELDVNGAALGEWRYGGAQGAQSMIYITVGTGIGGGVMVGGKLLHGLVHPEMGHILVRRHPDDTFAGHCPFHRDCLEGMAAGPAIQARWGRSAADLPPDHPAWEFESHYLAHAVSAMIYTLSPERVILGGGVMHQQHLFPRIRQKVIELLNNYIQSPAITERIDTVIIPPGLGDRAGIVGALELARMAAN